MENLLLLQMLGLGGGFGSAVDVAAVVAFVGFGVVAFLAPVVGYQEKRPAGLAAALHLLVAYVGVSVLLLLYQWTQLVDTNANGNGGGPFGGGRPKELVPHVLIAGALIKLVLFAGAMLSFALGVQSLRPRPRPAPADRPADRPKGEGW